LWVHILRMNFKSREADIHRKRENLASK